MALGIISEGHAWRMEWSEAAAYGRDVLRRVAPGTWTWARSMIGIMAHTVYAGGHEKLGPLVAEVEALAPGPEGPGPIIHILGVAGYFLDDLGRFAEGTRVVERMGELLRPAGDDPIVRAWGLMNHASRSAYVQHDPWAGREAGLMARACFDEVRHHRGALLAQLYVGMNCRLLGLLDEAERYLLATHRGVDDEALGLGVSHRSVFLVHTFLALGRLPEARAEAQRLIDSGRAVGLPLHEGRGHLGLASVAQLAGEPAALEHAEAALALLGDRSPMDEAAARATLAEILTLRGRVAEAVDPARSAMAAYDGFGGGFHDARVRLSVAKVLTAAGDEAGAREVARRAWERLSRMAERIPDPQVRERFAEIPEHRELRALAARGSGPAD